jgi:hypothetical protein
MGTLPAMAAFVRILWKVFLTPRAVDTALLQRAVENVTGSPGYFTGRRHEVNTFEVPANAMCGESGEMHDYFWLRSCGIR